MSADTDRYVLDLENARLPSWWPEWSPRRIPLRPGRYGAEFDVVEEEMPQGWRERFVAHMREHFVAGFFGEVCDRLPVSFYRRGLPPGGVLLRVVAVGAAR